MAKVYLGAGANLGDRAASLRAAAAEIGRLPATRLLRTASVIETDPVGGPPQPRYLNTVFEVETDLTPQELLKHCAEIERRLGRVRSVRFGPRTMDLDILLFGDCEVNEPDLTIPHPRMAEREFVLKPLAELAPDAVHPVLLKTISDLREGLKRSASGKV